jgi:hypothetical protein
MLPAIPFIREIFPSFVVVVPAILAVVPPVPIMDGYLGARSAVNVKLNGVI